MRVVEAKVLALGDLQSLFANEVVAVRVPDFYPRQSLEGLTTRMCDSTMVGTYANAPDIARIGVAYFEKQTSADVADEYELNSIAWINRMRQAALPNILPNDQLRLALDEAWPAGSTLATLDGHRAFCGLIRIFRAGSMAEPHMDVLEWDRTAPPEQDALAAQIAANIYIRMPRTGGALMIWPISLSRAEYQRGRRPDSYGLADDALSGEPITLRPRDGELILFNARHVHAVTASDDGDRITSSCFVGMRSIDVPLSLWS